MTRVIDLANVGKRYWQLHEQAMLLKSLIPGARPKRSELWAVRGVDLHIAEGETVGLIGHNGAGKTTLLRMLAGVSRPTEGTVRVRGRVAPLIGVGVGFHMEMSGRENVLVNGMLLGLTRSEVERRFDEIVDFAELEDFIDTPVKFYSTGMFLRLGFAVAVHVRPRIMLVDEILAVGDLGFQRKCFDRMRDLQADGTTILVVSHSMHAVRLLCPRAVLLDHGRVLADGSAEDVIARHHELMSSPLLPESAQASGEGSKVIDVLSRELIEGSAPTHSPRCGSEVVYRATLRFNSEVDSPQFFFRVTAEDGAIAYQIETAITRSWGRVGTGDVVEVEVPFVCRLVGGTYALGLIVSDRDAHHRLLSDPMGMSVFVPPRLGRIGVADLDARILVGGQDMSTRENLLIAAPQETQPKG